MKTATEKKRDIKPILKHEITIYEYDLLHILGVKHIMCKYEREGSATLEDFRSEDGLKRISQDEAKRLVHDWLVINGYLCDLEDCHSRFEVTHHFSVDEDYDGCRHSVYGCTYKLWYDPLKTNCNC